MHNDVTNGLEVVTDGGLDSDGTSLMSEAVNLSQEVKSLGSLINELLQEWTGDAASRFSASWEAMRAQLQGLASTLESKGQSLVQNSRLFEDTELSNKELFDRIGD